MCMTASRLITPSSFFMVLHSNHIMSSTTSRRQRKRLHTVQSRSNGLSCLVYQNTSIIIESHHTSIWSLIFLMRSYYNSVSDVSSSYFVGSGNRNGTTRTSLRTERTLFLDNYYYAIAWWREEKRSCQFGWSLEWLRRTVAH